jgi:hypothetical protein
MAGTAGAAEEGTENSLLAPLTADKFQGFATKDGEPIAESKVAAKTAAKADAKATTKAKVAAEDGEDGDQGDREDGQEGQANTPKPKDLQTRINKAVGRQRAAERERDALAATNRTLEQRLANIEGQMQLLTTGKKPPSNDAAPDPADYKNGDIDARYIADLARYEGRKAAKAARADDDKAAKTEAEAKAARDLAKRVGEFADKGSEKYEDFQDVVFDEGFPLSPTLGELALESDHGAEILYTLASDSKESKRVLGMTPARQAAWFGTREAELSSESSDAGEEDESEDEDPETPPKATKSPQPSNHKTRGTGGVPRISASTTDFAAFERMAKGASSR